jgi:protein SMG6
MAHTLTFVLLHGMLFANIQLDDFLPTLAHFLERIDVERAEERERIMMAVVDASAILKYEWCARLVLIFL